VVRAVSRCPFCTSSVVLERDFEGLALVCLGCARRWSQVPSAVLKGEQERARLRADPSSRRPGRPRKKRPEADDVLPEVPRPGC
jgi:hypothetical protein